MDNKYGRLFTLQDMVAFASILEESDISVKNGKAVTEALNDFEGYFPKEEPLFLLRGKDRRALNCVRNYRTMISYSGSGTPAPGLIEGLTAAVVQFEDFAREHPDRLKDPD